MSTGCCGAPRRCCYWRSGVEQREQINPQDVETGWLDLKTEGLDLERSFTTHRTKHYAIGMSSAILQTPTFQQQRLRKPNQQTITIIK